MTNTTKYHKTSTPTLAMAMRILARDIISDDFITKPGILEAAERIEELYGMTRWNKIDYSNPETFPEENRPCLIAWESNPINSRLDIRSIPDFPYTSTKQFFINTADVGVCSWFSVEVLGFYEGIRPTHWLYAPEFKP